VAFLSATSPLPLVIEKLPILVRIKTSEFGSSPRDM